MIAHLSSLIAGGLSTLSPCVLPALPLIVGGAAQRNKLVPLYLSFGLITAFTLVGVSIAQFGHVLGLDADLIRNISALMMIVAGLSLFSTSLQNHFQKILAPIVNQAGIKSSQINSESFGPQFSLGFLIGAVWSPCVGPTLGTAIGLATNTSTLSESIGMMMLYGVGATFPLLAVAYSSKNFFKNFQPKLLKYSVKTKKFFSISMIMTGLLVLSGLDKKLEAVFLDQLPLWWVDLVSRL